MIPEQIITCSGLLKSSLVQLLEVSIISPSSLKRSNETPEQQGEFTLKRLLRQILIDEVCRSSVLDLKLTQHQTKQE